MKIGMTAAAALLLAALLAGCADGGGTTADDGQNGAGTEGYGAAGTGGNGSGTGSGIPSVPAVELPPAEGEDVFKGRTFSDGNAKYVFSYDGTVECMAKREIGNGFDYAYSVNKDGDLCMKMESINVFDMEWCTFEQVVQYMWSDKYYESLRADLRKEEWTTEEYIERIISNEKKRCTIEKPYGYPWLRNEFAYHRYAVEETGGGFVLTEQYEASSAWFDLHSGSDSIDLDICPGIGIANFSLRRSDGEKEKAFYSYFSSNSESGGTISFINYEDASEVFPATYKIVKSGNDGTDITVEMSFKYGGVQYDETLDFMSDTIHLTEGEAAASSPRN